jgi:hypothetical protein
MRFTACAVLTASILAATPAFAQAWHLHTFPDDQFSISFPGTPTIANGTFTAPDGTKYAARVYTMVDGKNRYTSTVSDFTKSTIDGVTAVDLAAQVVAKRGEIKFDIPSRAGQIFGRELNVVYPDGSQSMMSIFYARNRLYETEMKTLPPDAEEGGGDGVRFVESIGFAGNVGGPGAPGGGGAPGAVAGGEAGAAPAAPGAARAGGQGAN